VIGKYMSEHKKSSPVICKDQNLRRRQYPSPAATHEPEFGNESRLLPEVFAVQLKAVQYIIPHPYYVEDAEAGFLDKDNLPCWNPDKIPVRATGALRCPMAALNHYLFYRTLIPPTGVGGFL
jgi:hypothetical protein